jgi:hypothetical protein
MFSAGGLSDPRADDSDIGVANAYARVMTAARLSVVLSAALVSGVPASALAFECTLDRRACLVSPRWESRIVPYTIESPPEGSPIDRAGFERATRAAFAHWAEPACTDLTIEEQAASPFSIRVVTAGWTRDPRDLEAVLTHEVGHYIGFAHPCEYPGEAIEEVAEGNQLPPCPTESCDALEAMPGDLPHTILWPEAMSCETAIRTLGPDDVAAVCSIYPRGADPLPCATLPEQDTPYVGNAAFGCTDVARPRASRGSSSALALLILAGIFARKRSAS